MAKTLDFNKVPKKYLNVTLADEKQTVLMIGTPTKAVMDDLIALQNYLEEINEDEANTEITDELYSACARVMSRNKGGIKIDKDYLADLFDFEDITIFFNAYMEFISEVTNTKN